MGNVLGRFGTGPRVLAFDAHIDTVGISNPTHWRHDPFRGIVTGGTLFGRGASDQKGGVAAVVHGVARGSGGTRRRRHRWVTATVNGEDCVGLAWQYILNETDLRPEVVVIAMPSHLGVCFGQRGRMEVEISPSGYRPTARNPTAAATRSMTCCRSSTASESSTTNSRSTTPAGARFPGGHRDLIAVAFADRDSRRVHHAHRPPTHHRRDGRRRARPNSSAFAEVGEHGVVRLLHYDLPSWRGFTYPTDKVFPAWETPRETGRAGCHGSPERVLGRHRASTVLLFPRTAARPPGCTVSRPSVSVRPTSSTRTPSTTRSPSPSSNQRWPSMPCIRPSI